MDGTIYLIHFDRPLKHARHYIGWAKDLEGRIGHHRSGNGSRLMRAVNLAGIGWDVVWTKEGDRNEERRLKRYKKSAVLCPLCKKNSRRRKKPSVG